VGIGGIERGINRCFLVPVEKRDKETLLKIIKDWFLPNTKIISDCWKVCILQICMNIKLIH